MNCIKLSKEMSQLSCRDPQNKTDWFRNERFGAGPRTETDKDQQKLRKLGPVRANKILKISDLFGQVGPQIWQSWIPGEKNLMYTRCRIQFAHIQHAKYQSHNNVDNGCWRQFILMKKWRYWQPI